MIEWLMAPVDPSRAHDIDFAISLHARSMTLAWAVLAPLAVLVARYFKIMPGQDWPRELDNQFWWRSHWIGQGVVVALTIIGFVFVAGAAGGGGLHGRLGYGLLVLVAAQVALGIFRGTKGGPTATATGDSLRGDHYDMTPWRVAFELLHKSLGYLVLALAAVVIVLGFWQANGSRWILGAILIWWLALISVSCILQIRGRAIDTYQAIWGPDPVHPGNNRTPIGWGIRRYREGAVDVRRD